MTRVTTLDKFTDARGWSVNDIYSIVPKEQRCQVNYSILYPGVVKAWHRHQYQDDYFFVLHGMAQVGVYSDENGAEKHFIGEHNPSVIHIKAGEWHGLTVVGSKPVGLLYFVTNNYNSSKPDEERAPHDSFVGHDWWLPENK
jgi:dTDP-4-dehydrorhamnose 3,5-epimerase|tara:strand:- start:63 stop:488 length:426 start_codon:yes stop_codon:yes gene_type:complete